MHRSSTYGDFKTSDSFQRDVCCMKTGKACLRVCGPESALHASMRRNQAKGIEAGELAGLARARPAGGDARRPAIASQADLADVRDLEFRGGSRQ
jgi:hypothetical protein